MVLAAAAVAPPSSLPSARPAQRPKSAGVGVHKLLRLRNDERSDGRAATIAAASTRRMFAKPRPPSASSTLISSSAATRRPRPQLHSNNLRGDASNIAPQILREEIETQCKVTRHAQREYNALRVQLTSKRQEVALLERHVQAFDVDALPGPQHASARTPAATSASASPAAGGPRGHPQTPLEKLHDETRRLDAYKKTLRTMLDRLARQMHFLRANAELLESQRVAAVREAALCQDKVAQDKSLCAELENKRTQLQSERAAHALHAQQLLASLRSELSSRRRVCEQRQDADRRREEMLRLVESRPSDRVHTASTTSGYSQSPVLEKRHSYGRRDSFHMLMNESLAFFGAPAPGSRVHSADGSAATAVVLSSRRLQTLRGHTSSAAAETFAASMNRETFYQVYETQYERILEQTGELDLAIVLERFRGYHETRARLEQIERDLAAEDTALDAARTARSRQLEQLRLSGTAEVEKRKKIRDFLEQQFLVKSAARAQAQDAFVDQVKMFSFVQQGIINITELLKCLDDKFSPPVLATGGTMTSTSSSGSVVHRSVLTPAAAVEIDWLQSLLNASRSVVRATASLSSRGEFTLEQIARLGVIDPTIGVAAGAWTVERLRYSIPGGNVIRTSGPNGQCIEDAADEDDGAPGQDSEGDASDSDSDVDDRDCIKHHEAETLAQAELLIRTLDSRQQVARQEQTLQRMRRAFGLGEVNEESEESQDLTPLPLPPAANAGSKLAAVHAFFREKRLREKHEQQERREAIVTLGGLAHQLSGGHQKKRDPVAGGAGNAIPAAVGMVSLLAEMRDGPPPAARSSMSALKSAVSTSLTKLPPQRKRSNAVSFSVPLSVLAEQASQLHHQQQGGHSTTADDSTSRRLRKPPTRPSSAASGTSTPLRRRGSNTSNGVSGGDQAVAVVVVGRPRPESLQTRQT